MAMLWSLDMPVSGLAITLSDDELRAADAMHALSAHPAVQLGERFECKLSIATDTADDKADRALQEWIRNLPGIVHIDITFVAFDDHARLNA